MVKVRIEGLPEEVETFTELLEKDEKYEFCDSRFEEFHIALQVSD